MTRATSVTLGDPKGEHAKVSVWSRGYPGGMTLHDGNWLCVDITVRAASAFRFRSFLRTKDFADLQRGLHGLTAGAGDRARFYPRDPWLTAEITGADNQWTMAVCARDHASHQVAEFTVALTPDSLANLARDVDALVGAYPTLT